MGISLCGRCLMNDYNLKKITDYTWTISNDSEQKICLFGSEKIIKNLDQKVFEQITNVANLPGLVEPAMTMPDAHWGYGFPIGGVAAFDPKKGGIISAGGVGFDISCGVRCLRSNLSLDDILPHAEKLAQILFKTIPAGVGKGGKLKLGLSELNEVLKNGAKWAVQKGLGVAEDLQFIEEQGCMKNAVVENVSPLAKDRQLDEMGTLGSGNHYLEIQIVKEIYDEAAAEAYGLKLNQVVVSIHCGSRGLGHQIGSDFLVSLAKASKKLGINLPERELACAPILSEEGQQYLGAMRAGINCALANRQILTHLCREAFDQTFPNIKLETLYDVSHNTCKEEMHLVNGKQTNLFVHRKGATRAWGPGHSELPAQYKSVGQPVIIGGSMGTASYILAGCENNSAFDSACHGAGRAMGRREALKHWRGKELIEQLAQEGILIMSSSLRGVAEEAPLAYKDVNEVVISTEKAGLARRVCLLLPKICVKG